MRNAMALTLWRDYDSEATALPGIELNVDTVSDSGIEQAREYFIRGVRRVAFDDVVDLSGDGDTLTAFRALVLLRELTSHGIVIDWTLRPPGQWRLLSHLYPPSAVTGAPRVARTWREEYHHGKYVVRRGPGFAQIRDHRFGALKSTTINDPGYLAALDRMMESCSTADLLMKQLHDSISRGIVLHVNEQICWLPCRPYRWPCPSMSL
jgi:hypothetical protein